MHAVELTAWDDWGHHKDDPFEDAICIAKREEGERLSDALDEIQIFARDDIRHETFESPEELAEVLRIFDELVAQAHRRFSAYSERLHAIQEEHHGNA